VRIAKLLGFAASEVHYPGFGLRGDRRLSARPRQIVERRDRTIGQRPFNAALNGLMVHSSRLRHRKKGRVFPIGEQQARPLNPPRRFVARPRDYAQRRHVLLANCQFQRLPPSRHDLNPHCESNSKATSHVR
jgi:hypothetical protein